MTLWITFYDHVRYTKDDFMNRDRDFFGNGVVAATDFPLLLTTGLNFTIGAGTAWVDGYRISNDGEDVISLNVEAPESNSRWDIVQIGHDDNSKSAVLKVKKGVADGKLIEPGADPYFLKLFAIKVDPNTTKLTAENVVDRRNLVPLKVTGSQIAFDGAVRSTTLGQPNGVATLDGNAHIPVGQLPYGMDQSVSKADAPQFSGMTSTGDINVKKAIPYLNLDASRTNKSYIRWNANSTSDLGMDFNVDGTPVLGLTSDKKATFQGQIVSKVATGTAPFSITSTTPVSNLNADMVDGKHASDFVAATEKGAINGVAQLGSDGKVPTGQLPPLDYIPTSSAGAASGVATLDANKKIPVAQLPYGMDQSVLKADTPQFAGMTSTGNLTIKKGVGVLYFDASRANTSYVRWNASTTNDFGMDFNVDGVKVLSLTSDKKATVEGQIESKTPAGTAPLIVASNTVVANLNAELLEGLHASDFIKATDKGAFNGVATLDSSGNIPKSQLGNVQASAASANLLTTPMAWIR
ncbi:hypothetical protein [Tumebacillus flagellatus]|uniref:Uncharacterized protein n=1 Tax=Tumebacillus flagellatus TaxID=1157490 RepID=A0A074LLZ4_9BACL|nr:hypothetical protein [Tumebacillus flagellatus]KEO82094.1 hypothetical protein EL26_17445 [Tumebacillus flagellatus]